MANPAYLDLIHYMNAVDMESLKSFNNGKIDRHPIDLMIDALPEKRDPKTVLYVSIGIAQDLWDKNVNNHLDGQKLVSLFGKFVVTKGQMFRYRDVDCQVC